MNPHAVAGYMAFTLYIGAAVNDGTSEQRIELRSRISPMLESWKTLEDRKKSKEMMLSILETVHLVMPEGWRPTGESREYIMMLLEMDK